MPAKRDKIAMRILVSLLAALLVPTLVSQALAQAERQEQETPAREASDPDVIPFPSSLPVTNWDLAIGPAPDIEAAPISLVQLEAATLFPATEAPAESDSKAATAPAAVAVSTTAWVVIAIAAAAAVAILVFVEPG